MPLPWGRFFYARAFCCGRGWSFLFDLNWQTRTYLDNPAGGPFLGTYVSAEVFHAGIGRTEAVLLTLTTRIPEIGLTIEIYP